MSGDPLQTRLWADADVYVAFSLATAEPANVSAVFPAGWSQVGLLDGDDGFVEGHDQDKSAHFAWGGVQIKTGRAHDSFTVKFSALEDNDATFRLWRPGSTRNGDIVVPRPERVQIGFETREGVVVHRLLTANYAEVEVDGDVTQNETDPAKLQFIATIYPDASESPAVLFHEQTTESPGS